MILKQIPNALGLLALLAIATSCSTSRPAPTNEERFRSRMAIANASLSENDPTSALQALAEAEKLDPGNPDIHYARTRAYHLRHDLQAALTELRKYVEKEPKSSDGQLSLGIIMVELNRPREAIAPFTLAANDPLYDKAWQAQTNLGIILYRQGDQKEASVWFDKAIAFAPAKACIAHYYRGHLFLKDSQFKEAATSYERSTHQFCADFSEGFLALGIAYQHLGEYQKARKAFVEIQNRFPGTQLAEQAMERLRSLP